MKWLFDRIQEEPVLFQAFIQALLSAIVGFGVISLSQEKIALLLGVSSAILAFITRRYVTPLSKPQNDEGAPLAPTPH